MTTKEEAPQSSRRNKQTYDVKINETFSSADAEKNRPHSSASDIGEYEVSVVNKVKE